MKKLNLLLIAILGISLVLNTSCKKDDDDDGISIGDGCSASWKVNGTDYSEDDLTLCIYVDGTLNLSASVTGGSFQLQIDPISSTGTYVADINNQDLSVFVGMILDDGTQLGSSNVTVNVTELSSSKAKGTFSGDFFDLADLMLDPVFSVTNGSFNANF